jgi:hypothetical protein
MDEARAGEVEARMTPWMLAAFVVAFYCIARGIADLRQRRFLWGAAGILCGFAIALVPIEVRAVKYDLIPPANLQR